MSRVVLSKDERQEFFKKFKEAIEYSYSNGLLQDFLLDFFSETELDSFIKRLEVFKRLHAGDSYSTLNHELSVSPITASKVSRSLKDSSESFKEILESLSSTTKTIKEEKAPIKDSKRSSYLG